MRIITIQDAKRKCGHKETYSINTGGTDQTAIKFALLEDCSICKRAKIDKIRELRDIAIKKARIIMESKGFMDCQYSDINNDGKNVEVILIIKI